MSYHIAKGVFDILPHDPDPEGRWRESFLWNYVEKTIRTLVAQWGYQEIRTPLFETTDLFTRSIGTDSDIVTKEMYTFQDKGGRNLTLRPEGTAPVMRAYIEKNLHQQSPLHKLFYLCPMFRYERQQAGRYRQHHQFGVEVIGSPLPHQEVETISLLWTLYERLGLRNLTLQLHSVGNEAARKAFRHELKLYLRPHLESLSAESQKRYETNPLRILDSKNPHDQHLLKEAPQLLSFLEPAEKVHFERVCHLLQKLDIPFKITPHLVRGLDYYNNTVFEVTSDALGAQNSLGGGGRYDGLIPQLGGPDMPAFGFGAGIERIIQTLLAQSAPLPSLKPLDLFLIPVGEEAKEVCLLSLLRWRQKAPHLALEMEMTDKKLKNALRYADQLGSRYVAVIGSDELASGEVVLKEMASGRTLQPLPFERILDALQTHA